jgi:hypothetical protein
MKRLQVQPVVIAILVAAWALCVACSAEHRTAARPDAGQTLRGSANSGPPRARDASSKMPVAQADDVRADAGADAQPLRCGGEICNPWSSRLMPCCMPDDSCGLGIPNAVGGGFFWCDQVQPIGEPSPACPSANFGPALDFEGCCRPDRLCGLLDWVGLGCIERTRWEAPPPETAVDGGGGRLEAISCGTPEPIMSSDAGDADWGS